MSSLISKLLKKPKLWNINGNFTCDLYFNTQFAVQEVCLHVTHCDSRQWRYFKKFGVGRDRVLLNESACLITFGFQKHQLDPVWWLVCTWDSHWSNTLTLPLTVHCPPSRKIRVLVTLKCIGPSQPCLMTATWMWRHVLPSHRVLVSFTRSAGSIAMWKW